MRNFLSVGNVTQAIHLDENLLTLVLGNNQDSNNGSSRNGAGKSTLLQAISFALYGQPLTKIKLDNLINNINKKGMFVSIDFSVGDRDFRVERGRKPNILRFYENGNEIIENEAQGENRETQFDIAKLIGMSHNMFTQVVALNTYTTPFLKQRAAEQREVIEELLGVTQISQRAENLKKVIGITKEGLRNEQARINAVTDANRRIEDAISTAEDKMSAWQLQHDQHVATLAQQIEELSTIDFDREKELFDELDAWNTAQRDAVTQISSMRDKKTGLKRELDRLRLDSNSDAADTTSAAVARLEGEKSRKEADVERAQSDLTTLHDKVVAKKAEIENADQHNCSTCSQPLAGTDHLDKVKANLAKQLEKIVSDIAHKEEAITALKDEAEAVDAEIVSVKAQGEEARKAAEERKAKNANKVKELEKEISELDDQIESAKDASVSDDDKPSPLFIDRDELYVTKQLLDSCNSDLEREREAQNPHVPHLESLRSTLQVIEYTDLETLTDELAHQEFLHKLLTNKDSFIRRKIIEQNLAYLNQRVSHYTSKLGLPHEVVFQSDLSVEIMQLGQDFDFDQLSRGEQLRVILSVSWSFRDVWESLNHSINLLWVDEMLDAGVDSSGAEAGLSVLKSMGRDRGKNVFLISHRDELVGRIESIMMVSKRNGFTHVEDYQGT